MACALLWTQKYFYQLTQQSLQDASLSVAEDQGVGACLQVGGVNVHLLGVNVGDGWVELVHEEDEVAHVDVVAEAVDDEEEVAPVLSWLHTEWSGLLVILLIILLQQIFSFSLLL